MFEQYSFQKKNNILAAAFVLAVVIAYFLAFDKTISLYQENTGLKMTRQQAEGAPEKIKALKIKKERIDQLLSGNRQSLRKEILEKVSGQLQSRPARLVSFAAPVEVEEQDVIMETYELILEGKYTALLQVTHALEQEIKSGHLSSVSLYTQQERESRQTKLYARLMIQSIRENEKK